MELVKKVVESNPQLRFNQILHGLNIVKSDGSSFYDEPEEVIKRIEESDLYRRSNERGSFKGVY